MAVSAPASTTSDVSVTSAPAVAATNDATAYAGMPAFHPKCRCRTVADAKLTVVCPEGKA